MNKWDITALKGVFLRTSSLEKFKDIVARTPKKEKERRKEHER